MERRRVIAPDLRVHAPLLKGRSESGLLVSRPAASRRATHVLRWLGPPGAPHDGAEALGARLRHDLAELGCLRHSSLALLTRVGRDWGGRPYLLRPYVRGTDCRSALQGSAVHELGAWFVAAAEALACMHRLNLLHARLAPGNLIVPRRALLGQSRGASRVVLVDPEWRELPPAATYASDLLALGAVYYLLLTGREVDTATSAFPEPPSSLNAEVPVDLERVVMKLLNPNASRRYRTVDLLLDDLRSIPGAKSALPEVPECFVGRIEEIECGKRALQDDRPCAIVVPGEGGIGKSAFLRRLELEAQLLGRDTVAVRCYDDGADPLASLRRLADTLSSGRRAQPGLRRRRRVLFDEFEGESDRTARARFLRGLIDLCAESRRDHPTLLLFDDVHEASPLTIEFLVELVRDITAYRDDRASFGRFPLSVAVACRSEGPFRARVNPLFDAVSSPLSTHTRLELASLDETAERRWAEAVRRDPVSVRGLELPKALRGNPLAIRNALHGAAVGSGDSGLRSVYESFFRALGASERRVLELLSLLGRPARLAFLEAVEGKSIPVQRVESLARGGTLCASGDELSIEHSSLASWIVASIDAATAGDLHGRIATALERRGAPIEEIARHWLLSNEPERGAARGLWAARKLARLYEDRRALGLLERAIAHIPANRGSLRDRVARGRAELHARIGEHRRGVALLEDLLEKRSGADAGLVHGRIGHFERLAGNVSRATFHLEKGLALLDGARCTGGDVALARARVRIEAELAELAGSQGGYRQAEAICHRALRQLEEMPALRSAAVRRERVGLLETLGITSLRRFRYAAAADCFGRALDATDGLGDIPERSLVLNNLGVVHSQQDRYRKAIECFDRARALSARIGHDAMLVSIDSNLAILHAKSGDPDAADEALRRAGFHDARCESTRTRFLRVHSSGVVDLLVGRYASAIQAFREALALGEEIGDRHTVAFDLVYLAECHLLRGEFRQCSTVLQRAQCLADAPRPIASMAAARRALLDAFRGRALDDAILDVARSETEIAYLDAWNGLLTGWALRLAGAALARSLLERSRAFFVRASVPAGEVLSALELAALDSARGNSGRAVKRLRALTAKHGVGRGALRNPFLATRLLTSQAELELRGESPNLAEATSLLVEAESYLIGHRFPDVEARVRSVKRRLAESAHGRRESDVHIPASDRSVEEALSFMAGVRDATNELLRRAEVEVGEEHCAELRRSLREYEDRLAAARRQVEGGRAMDGVVVTASALLGGSVCMAEVRDVVRQAAATDLPVLITGETGCGKDLVARAIHGESGRRSAAFVSVNCAAVPGPLIEAELFGHVAGAFTGAELDRDGLLVAANGGTFFFDEITELPLELQGALLRLCDRRAVRPLGGIREVELDVRFVCAAHSGLDEALETGAFRRDLFHRLKGIAIDVPPLRERVEDIPALFEHFVGARVVGDPPTLEEAALEAMIGYAWPGNVRELRNLCDRLAVLNRGRVCAEEIRRLLGESSDRGIFSAALLRSRPLADLVDQLEREYLVQLQHDHAHDVRAMSRALGITPRALYKRFRRLGISTRRRDG